MDIERTIDIAAPHQDVWRIMTDVKRWPEWTASVTSVDLLDQGDLHPGSRVRVRQPRLPAVVWTVTVLEAGRYFEWQNLAPGLKTVAGHRLEGRGGAGARVTLSVGWSGVLAPLMRLVYGNLSRRYVDTEAEGLKRRSEAR